MAFTQTDLDAVNTALLRGEKSVQFADRSVTYRSVDEILKVKEQITSELGRTNRRRRQFLGYSSKGLS